ncbi:acyl-CoA thioesterase [Rugamonas sp. A1-17]|nr:acyl-CoA thioesterase [Rugamonas sp. A1-17]
MAGNTFDLRHVVTFEETNLVGNVYYTNYFSWQGRCREMFLRQHAPQTLAELRAGELRLVTAHASCDYVDEFNVFDEIVIRLSLNRFIAYGLSLNFDYVCGQATLARGRQDIKFLRQQAGRWALTEVPDTLIKAARLYE